MFLERFKEVENFTITKLPLGGSKKEKNDQLTAEFGNVFLTCSKSGKLNSQLFQKYTESILKPYVKDNKFVL